MAFYLFLVLSLFLIYKAVYGKSGVPEQPGFPRVLNEHHEHDLKDILMKHIKEGNFDCVDIYKQPAFQHPLLKNHKIQVMHTDQSK
ncbi:hypothetical protein L6164_012091 [Bauhinia variegata]|uniref:Uncharacterized protein n=1 Tax=Bauhinia variegata TaxID=167791 RepID=A0ACB9P8W6_BAUVA|nr:hypothetical protein L6164_012091 [Bauhinia variegata]